MPTEAEIEAVARSDAEFDKRPLDCLGRADRDRYMVRARAAIAAARAAALEDAARECEILADDCCECAAEGAARLCADRIRDIIWKEQANA